MLVSIRFYCFLASLLLCSPFSLPWIQGRPVQQLPRGVACTSRGWCRRKHLVCSLVPPAKLSSGGLVKFCIFPSVLSFQDLCFASPRCVIPAMAPQFLAWPQGLRSTSCWKVKVWVGIAPVQVGQGGCQIGTHAALSLLLAPSKLRQHVQVHPRNTSVINIVLHELQSTSPWQFPHGVRWLGWKRERGGASHRCHLSCAVLSSYLGERQLDLLSTATPSNRLEPCSWPLLANRRGPS
jgi:hypothetical protein